MLRFIMIRLSEKRCSHILLFVLQNHVGYLLFESDFKNNHSRRIKACQRQSGDANRWCLYGFLNNTVADITPYVHRRQVTQQNYNAHVLIVVTCLPCRHAHVERKRLIRLSRDVLGLYQIESLLAVLQD